MPPITRRVPVYAKDIIGFDKYKDLRAYAMDRVMCDTKDNDALVATILVMMNSKKGSKSEREKCAKAIVLGL